MIAVPDRHDPRTVGLLGGMSWVSTALYYRVLNEGVHARLGALHSAPLVLWSVDFERVQRLQRAGDVAGETALLVNAARAVEAAGAGCLLICSNTMHRPAPAVQAAIGIPLLHIADTLGERLVAAGHTNVGLLGTRFTMDGDFYAGRLRKRFGVDVVRPLEHDRDTIQEIITNELSTGTVSAQSRTRVRAILRRLIDGGAEAGVLACTSLGLLLEPGDADVPLYDTAIEHARAALDWSTSPAH